MRRAPEPAGSSTPAAGAPLVAPGLARRMACWLYEGMLIFGVLVAAGLVFSIAADMRHGLSHRTGLIAFLFLVLAAYFTVLWSKGQTLAMQTWRLRIVDRHGRRLTKGRAFLRYVFSYIWVLPPLAAFGSSRVSVGAVLALMLGGVPRRAALSGLHPERLLWIAAAAGARAPPAPPAARP